MFEGVLARDVAIAHGRDCRHDEVETRQVLLGSAGLHVLVSHDPGRGREALEFGDEEPQARESVAQDSEDEEEEHHPFELDAVHRLTSDLTAD